jgi:hypothetical protein
MTPAQAFTMASRLVKYRRNILKNNLKHVNVLHFFNRSNKFIAIGEVAFKKFVVYVEKITYKFKVYVNQGQGKSLSYIKMRHVYDFSLSILDDSHNTARDFIF